MGRRTRTSQKRSELTAVAIGPLRKSSSDPLSAPLALADRLQRVVRQIVQRPGREQILPLVAAALAKVQTALDACGGIPAGFGNSGMLVGVQTSLWLLWIVTRIMSTRIFPLINSAEVHRANQTAGSVATCFFAPRDDLYR